MVNFPLAWGIRRRCLSGRVFCGDEVLPRVLPAALAMAFEGFSGWGVVIQVPACSAHTTSRWAHEVCVGCSGPLLGWLPSASPPPEPCSYFHQLGWCIAPHDGCAGLQQDGLLHRPLILLFLEAEILDSAWACTWVWWVIYFSICSEWESRHTFLMAEMAIVASESMLVQLEAGTAEFNGSYREGYPHHTSVASGIKVPCLQKCLE